MSDDEFEKQYDLTILPVRKTTSGIKQLREVSPILPDIKTGACCAIVSTPKSGKGNLIMNLLLRESMFRDAFQDVYVFSSTSKSDQTCKRRVSRVCIRPLRRTKASIHTRSPR